MAQRSGAATDRPGPTVRLELDDGVELSGLVKVLRAVRDGDLRVRLEVVPGTPLAESAALYNEIVDRQQVLCAELDRVATVVGRDGRITERIAPGVGRGAWEAAVISVNRMLDGIAGPIAEIDRVIEALADGELREAVAHPADLAPDGRTLRGDVLRKARSVNRLASLLKDVHDAIAWLAATVGGEIALTDNPAETPFRPDRMPGEWAGLIAAMDHSWNRLGGQVQELLQVTSAVADGDLSRKVEGPASGAMAGLKRTINDMVDQLSDFSSAVIRVTRELGTEGRLGG